MVWVVRARRRDMRLSKVLDFDIAADDDIVADAVFDAVPDATE